jgi:hypothetical protein
MRAQRAARSGEARAQAQADRARGCGRADAALLAAEGAQGGGQEGVA